MAKSGGGGGTNLGTAYISIVPLMEGAASKIEEALSSTGSSVGEEAGTRVGDGFASALHAGAVKAAGLAASAVREIGSAAVDLVKQSISAYADYEQLAGGVELALGEAYDFVSDKAANAFKTVQLSQTDYLEQVNGLAVGLRESLGGNQQAAAELADRVVTAEADIVAATGNTQEAVQNAFNGIMKGNFTMLDNLSLGITPTQEGFQKLIDSVNAWHASQGDATEYTIDSLADCQSALVDYVEMMGYSGYASDEASSTISGSVAMVTAAWQNFITDLGNSDADLSVSVGNLVESIGVAAEAFIPRIVQIVDAISEALPELISSLAPVIVAQLPTIVEAAGNLFMGIVTAIPPTVDALIEALPAIIDSLVDFLVGNLSAIVTASIELFFGILEAVPVVIEALAPRTPEIVGAICGALVDNIPVLVEASTELFMAMLECIPAIVSALFECGPQIVQGLIDGLWSMAGALWDAVTSIFGGVVDLVLGIFDINSPSRVMHYVGEMDMKGITGGIDDNASLPAEAMEDAMYDVRRSAYMPGQAVPAIAATTGGATYNVNFGTLSYGGVDGSTTLEEIVGGAMRYMRMGALVEA